MFNDLYFLNQFPRELKIQLNKYANKYGSRNLIEAGVPSPRPVRMIATHGHVCKYYTYVHIHVCGPGSSVGIATDYGLDGPGIESRWDEIFRPSRPALGPIQPPEQWVPGISWGLSTAGACC